MNNLIADTTAVVPFYYVYAYAACLIFLLSSICIFFPTSFAATSVQFALYEMHALLDNAVWLFSIFSYDWKWAIPVTILICLAITAVKLSLAAVFVVRSSRRRKSVSYRINCVTFRAQCRWCQDAIKAAIFSILMLSSSMSTSCQPQRTL